MTQTDSAAAELQDYKTLTTLLQDLQKAQIKVLIRTVGGDEVQGQIVEAHAGERGIVTLTDGKQTAFILTDKITQIRVMGATAKGKVLVL